jgi:hypothetical protein
MVPLHSLPRPIIGKSKMEPPITVRLQLPATTLAPQTRPPQEVARRGQLPPWKRLTKSEHLPESSHRITSFSLYTLLCVSALTHRYLHTTHRPTDLCTLTHPTDQRAQLITPTFVYQYSVLLYKPIPRHTRWPVVSTPLSCPLPM